MSLLLMKEGYFPAIILKNDRKKYYDALEKAHKGRGEDFIVLVARALEGTIQFYFEAIPGLAAKFLTLAEAAEESLFFHRIPAGAQPTPPGRFGQAPEDHDRLKNLSPSPPGRP